MAKKLEKNIEKIMSLGFTREQAANALMLNSNEEQLAIEYLL